MMGVKRVVSKYNNENESLICDYSVDHIPISNLREILNTESEDNQALKLYSLDNTQLKKFMKYLPELTENDLDLVDTVFCYECYNRF